MTIDWKSIIYQIEAGNAGNLAKNVHTIGQILKKER